MELKKLGEISVTARKRTFNTPKEINQYLKDNKSGLNISQISEKLKLPKTQVEHYFRTDKSRAIPSPPIWQKLKEILNLDTKWDKVVTDFYEKEIEYEMTRRVYCKTGISPTLEGVSALVSAKSINMQSQPMKNTSQNTKIMEMQKTLIPQNSQTSIYSVADFHAKLFPLLESVKDSEKLVVRSFMKSLGLPSIKNHATYSWKMLRGCFQQTMDGASQKSSVKWMNWGMMSNGKCLTANTLEFPRIGKECSLSDILEEQVAKKYFLSKKMQERFQEYMENKEK